MTGAAATTGGAATEGLGDATEPDTLFALSSFSKAIGVAEGCAALNGFRREDVPLVTGLLLLLDPFVGGAGVTAGLALLASFSVNLGVGAGATGSASLSLILGATGSGTALFASLRYL